MSFFAVLLALIFEQVKPLPRDNWVRRTVQGWAAAAGRNLDAGKPRHAWVVWAVTVVVPALAAAFAYLVVVDVSLLLALALDVVVLYLTLGFRQFSHHFTEIREALERGDEDHARRTLARWRRLDASQLPRTELLRHAIEHALLAAHRCVFGVFFWFVFVSALGLGPAGAVAYRMADFASRYWASRRRAPDGPVNERLCDLMCRAFALIDYVPARLTAAGFAIVGNFEEAVAGWRRDAGLWRQPNEGIILASAAGAVGVRLGGETAAAATEAPLACAEGAESTFATGSTPGAAPQLQHLQSFVGLVWRSVVLWLLLVALLTLANVVG